jgi:hypothetical protein
MPKLQFLRNLTAGNRGPLDRLRLVAGNLARRNLGKKVVCCGHYGDPGC